MPDNHIHHLFCFAAAVCLAGGCATPATPQQNRISAMQAEYGKLRPDERAEVAKGAIATGYRFEMVYMALGRPDEIETFSDGRRVRWRYRNFYPSAQVSPGSLYGIPKFDPLQRASSRWMNFSRRQDQDDARNGLRPAPKSAINLSETNIGPPSVTLDVVFIEGKVMEYLINGQTT